MTMSIVCLGQMAVHDATPGLPDRDTGRCTDGSADASRATVVNLDDANPCTFQNIAECTGPFELPDAAATCWAGYSAADEIDWAR